MALGVLNLVPALVCFALRGSPGRALLNKRAWSDRDGRPTIAAAAMKKGGSLAGNVCSRARSRSSSDRMLVPFLLKSHRLPIRRRRSGNGTASSVVAPSGRPNITPSSDRARGYDLGSAGSHARPFVCPLCRALGGARLPERSRCEHPLETACPASNSWLPRRVRGAGCRPWARPYGAAGGGLRRRFVPMLLNRRIWL
jgi:hypothetical protein